MSFFANDSVVREGVLKIQDKEFSTAHVLETLRPQLTESRADRIDEVVQKRSIRVAAVLEDIYDRGNASAVMRSAEGLGVQNVHMIQPGTRFKEANRVTQGADKWIDTKTWTSTRDCVEHLKRTGYKICVTTLEGGRPMDEVDFTEPTAIVLGNEKDGVSEEMLELADERVFIPMNGFTQSFNISVAAAIAFYHIVLKRTGVEEMSADEKETLRALYYLKSVESSEKILLKAD